jgi:UDP:flavonoid glycosyltransferase YjiC (YdhE family)
VRVERFVPQEQVLPRCAAVVAHAGSGSVRGALGHGLPLVLVPQGADQFDNAARCAAAGAAVVVRPQELAAEAVRLALKRVLEDPSFAEAARRVQAEIWAMPTERSFRVSRPTSLVARVAACPLVRAQS